MGVEEGRAGQAGLEAAPRNTRTLELREERACWLPPCCLRTAPLKPEAAQFSLCPGSQAGGPAEAHGEEAGLAEEHCDGSQDALGWPGHSFSSILSEQNQGTRSRHGPASGVDNGAAGLWHSKAFQTQGTME